MFSCGTFEVKSRCGIDQTIAATSATFHCPPPNSPRYQVVHTSTSPVQFKHTLQLEHLSNSKRVSFFFISDAPATTTVPATIAITTAPPPMVELQVTLQQVFVPALTDPQSTEFKTLSDTITTIVSPRNPDMTIHLCLC